MELDSKQQEAVELVTRGCVGIITGGPGTGKTTCLRTALETLRAQNRRVLLAAPTGKAARRMEEACGYPASTIHRALGWAGGDGWEYGPGNPLPYDVVIIDEASMLDVGLMDALLAAVDERQTGFFLVGDVDQLPSVGCGSVLGDLIDGGHVPVVRLETLHRAAQASWMNRNAPRILAGDFDALELDTQADFAFVRMGPKTAEQLPELVESELNTVQALAEVGLSMQEAFERLQVLIPMHKGAMGVNAINAMVQRAVQGDDMRPQEGWELSDGSSVYADDKVMQTKNDYELNLMNGEQGIVAGTQGDRLIVDVAGESYSFNRGQMRNLVLSYATTIHKSQGSEYASVIVGCHSSYGRMLSRQLIYTAVTRAKRRLVLVGDEEGLRRALDNDRVQERQTSLREAVQQAVGR